MPTLKDQLIASIAGIRTMILDGDHSPKQLDQALEILQNKIEEDL